MGEERGWVAVSGEFIGLRNRAFLQNSISVKHFATLMPSGGRTGPVRAHPAPSRTWKTGVARRFSPDVVSDAREFGRSAGPVVVSLSKLETTLRGLAPRKPMIFGRSRLERLESARRAIQSDRRSDGAGVAHAHNRGESSCGRLDRAPNSTAHPPPWSLLRRVVLVFAHARAPHR